MSEELSPCPFCGGEARIIVEPYESGYLVGCGDDGCHGFVGVNIRYESCDEAAEAWNRRTERMCRMELRWTDGEDGECYECSECGDIAFTHCDAPEYCPHCGAKVMER